ncbi:MAG: hypothetical protein GC162_02220 [Planctomycetes bacterium]|nr:hypothetical protein [Planctomycetota bacterium]
MPLVYKPEQLEVGMTLHSAVTRGAMVLLPAGRTLTQEDLNVLRKRFPEQRVRVGDPDLDSVVKFEDDGADSRVFASVMAKTNECMSMVFCDVKAARTKPNASNYTDIERAVSNVIAYLVANPIGRILPKCPFSPDSYLADHMANVFYLSMQLGSRLRWYVVAERERQTSCRDLSFVLAQSLLPLGLGALYMDMGMLDLSQIEANTGPLTEADWAQVHHHPETALERLPSNMSAAARMIVRTHHENCEGTGYPNRPDPCKLHVFTRIIRIADVFDAATTPRPYRPAKSAIRALWEMTYGPERPYYDPTLIKAFNELVMPFPVGTRLELDDGQTAIVFGPSRDPFAPRVVLPFDDDGKLKPADQIAPPIVLDAESGRRIARVDDEDVSYLYTTPAADNPPAAPPAPAWRKPGAPESSNKCG